MKTGVTLLIVLVVPFRVLSGGDPDTVQVWLYNTGLRLDREGWATLRVSSTTPRRGCGRSSTPPRPPPTRARQRTRAAQLTLPAEEP